MPPSDSGDSWMRATDTPARAPMAIVLVTFSTASVRLTPGAVGTVEVPACVVRAAPGVVAAASATEAAAGVAALAAVVAAAAGVVPAAALPLTPGLGGASVVAGGGR